MRHVLKQVFLIVCCLSIWINHYGCRTYYSTNSAKGELMPLDSLMAVDSSALAIIEPYKRDIDIEMNEIISYSEIDITKNQPEGLLNNFISDLVLHMCNKYYCGDSASCDVVILNNGGLRAALPKGLITVGDVYRLMPFENEAVVLTISSENFLEMVNYIIQAGGVPFAGMRIKTKQLQLTELTVNGEQFDENRTYTVITSDYLAAGGDKMQFFNNPLEQRFLSVLIRDLIINYLKEQNTLGNSIHPTLDGRIVYE
jgi:2',3'-cyclic-nucleotide 2'-phosphodiesterase (5'-nucleotidase family)